MLHVCYTCNIVAFNPTQNMKYLNLLMVAALLIAVSFSSCKKDVDDEVPVIAEFTVESKTVAAGSEIHADVVFTDNEALKSYKIDIHDAFDGHGHGKTGTPWSYQETFEISGKEFTEHKHIDVPVDAASGPYHFTIYVLDAEGNQSDFAEVDLMITNSSMPVITVTNLSETTETHADKGTTLILQGTVTDAVDLAEILVVLEEEGDHSHGKTSAEPLYENDIDLTGTSDVSFDLSTLNPTIDIPANAEEGDYALIIYAKDSDGNYSMKEYPIHIH